jgi:hypothetical protein
MHIFKERGVLDKDYFIDAIHIRTGGIPRLVRETIKGLVYNNNRLDSQVQIDHVLDTLIFTWVNTFCAKELRFDGLLDVGIARILLLFASLNIKFPIKYRLRVGMYDIPIQRLISMGNIYVRGESDYIQIVLPQYVLQS